MSTHDRTLEQLNIFSILSVLGKIIGFVLIVILARILPPAEMARFNLFLMFIGIWQISFLWIDQGIVRIAIKEYTSNNSLSRTVWSGFAIKLVLLVIGLCIIFVFGKSIMRFLDVRSWALPWMAVLSISIFIASIVPAFKAKQEFDLFAVISNFSVMAVQFMIILLMAAGVLKKDSSVFYHFYFIGFILMGAVSFRFLRKDILPLKFDKKYASDIILFSSPLLVHTIAGYFISYQDTFFVRYFLPIENVAYYGIAFLLFSQIQTLGSIPTDFITSLFSKKYEQNAHGDIIYFVEELKPVFETAWNILISIFLLASPFLLFLFGKDYENARLPLTILTVAAIPLATTFTITAILYAYKKIFFGALTSILAALLGLVLDIILIPKTGLIGAAFAAVISSLVLFLSRAYYVKHRMNLNILKDIYIYIPNLILVLLALHGIKHLIAGFIVVFGVYSVHFYRQFIKNSRYLSKYYSGDREI